MSNSFVFMASSIIIRSFLIATAIEVCGVVRDAPEASAKHQHQPKTEGITIEDVERKPAEAKMTIGVYPFRYMIQIRLGILAVVTALPPLLPSLRQREDVTVV